MYKFYERLISFIRSFFGSFFRLIVGEGFKLLDSLLQIDPSKRPSAHEAMNHAYFIEELPRPCDPSEYVPHII